MTSATRRLPLRGATAALLAAAQPLSTQVAAWTGRGTPEVAQAVAAEGPVTPAAGAFVVWAPLFAGSLLYARSDLSGEPDDAAARTAGWWVDAALAGNVLWSLNSQFRRLDGVSVALIGGSAASALTAVVRADRAPDTPVGQSVHRYVAPLAGWLSVATFANVEVACNRRRLPSPAVVTARAVGLVAAASVTAGAVTASLSDGRTYAATAAWGLAGIALKAVRSRSWPVAATAVLGAFGVAAAATRPTPGERPTR